MLSTFFFFSFVLGTIIGSFLNVVALRYGTQKNLGGRSSCMSCQHQLSWYELVPVVSFTALNGKCRNCKSKISVQYPLVEMTTGILFAFTFLKLFPLLEIAPSIFILTFAFLSVIFSILMVIVVYDMKHKMIPDGLVFWFIGLSLLWVVSLRGLHGVVSFPGYLDLLAGPLLALPFALLWLFSGGKWIGFGDAKLALGMGWFLGIVGGISAVALGFWVGAAVSILLLLVSKFGKSKIKISRNTEIPFAPFLVLGLVLVFFFNLDFFYIKEIINNAF